jgi:hypothetical protein
MTSVGLRHSLKELMDASIDDDESDAGKMVLIGFEEAEHEEVLVEGVVVAVTVAFCSQFEVFLVLFEGL